MEIGGFDVYAHLRSPIMFNDFEKRIYCAILYTVIFFLRRLLIGQPLWTTKKSASLKVS